MIVLSIGSISVAAGSSRSPASFSHLVSPIRKQMGVKSKLHGSYCSQGRFSIVTVSLDLVPTTLVCVQRGLPHKLNQRAWALIMGPRVALSGSGLG